jgi:hypothetical protein
MSLRRQILSIALPVVAIAMAAPSLGAQGRPLFQWAGRVDREVRITMRDRELWTDASSSNDRGRFRSDVDAPLPRRDGQVRVRIESGRGDVDVVQQPSSRNGYTTIVRIQDRSGGADRYRLSAYWMPSGNDRDGGWWGDDRRNDRRDDRRDDRRNDRGRDRDRWDDRDRGRYGDEDYGYDRGRGRGRARLLHWSGSVDGEIEIRLRDDQVTYRTLSGSAVRDARVDLPSGGLPERTVDMNLANAQGRGHITLVQRPDARNGYTAIVRVRDPQGGYGFYDFDLTWW